jgi:CheY-like chemotaxis protein
MKDEPMSPEVGHAFEVIGRSARSQATLIEDLLEVSRINTGKLVVSPKRMDLCGVICAVVESVRPTAEAKGISVHCDVDSLPDVNGDADRVQQVVWNLMSNAVKFTSNGGAVRVDASVDTAAGSVRVHVRDNGQGISAEFLPHVFERFRQADSSNTRRHGGLGIGLTIVRQIVELHGGNVSVQSDGIGHGSVFSFTLPIAATVQPAIRRDSPTVEADASEDLKGFHILLVDDDPDARDVITAVLKRFQARVSVAGSVEAALAQLEMILPDVIVSDISMPGEDGFSLIHRVQNLSDPAKARLPAIALTAHARPVDRDRTLAAGYSDHVVKPVNPSLLLAAIRNVGVQA